MLGMDLTDYNYYINDSMHSVKRLTHIKPDIQQFLYFSKKGDRHWTKDIDNLEDYYNSCLDSILIGLTSLDPETVNRDQLWDIIKQTWNISDIGNDLEEIMTNENFHSESRIMINEPLNISSNLNQIMNELH